MPGTLRVAILAARDLPIMDKSAETTDAFVEVRFASTSFKTAISPKSLNPLWENEVFTFECEDSELQDESLQLRVMDYDTYSANDAIGRVYVNLTPLVEAACKPNSDPHRPVSLKGWLPILDTMLGIRGELELSVELVMFMDSHKSRQSSCGLPIFACPSVPAGMRIVEVLGDVRDLITGADPEFAWLDKIRSPRATNEARQILFRSLSSQLARRIGRKAMTLHANAVLGYKVAVDVEGERSGLVVLRGLGTAVQLRSVSDFDEMSRSLRAGESATLNGDDKENFLPTPLMGSRGHSPSMRERFFAEGASFDQTDTDSRLSSFAGVESPKSRQTSIDANCPEMGDGGPRKKMSRAMKRQLTVSEQSEEAELDDALSLALNFAGSVPDSRRPHLPFLTLAALPDELLAGVGGVVSARSVKVLEDVEDKDSFDAASARSAWWSEIRDEIRSHLRALACNAVLGYREELVIRKDVCILSGSGTAIRMENDEDESSPCAFAHVSFSPAALPFNTRLHACASCGEATVGDVSLTTCEAPAALLDPDVPTSLIRIPVIRRLAEHDGEELAKEISNLLPFVEQQLHSALIGELKAQGDVHNAAFCLRSDIAVGENLLLAVLTATMGRLTPLTEGMPMEPEMSERMTCRSLDLTSKGTTDCIVITPKTKASITNGAKNGDRSTSSGMEREDSGLSFDGTLPKLCMQIWRGPFPADILGATSESGDEFVKSRIDHIIKGTLHKLRNRSRAKASPPSEELGTLLRHVMLSVGIVEDGTSGDAGELQLMISGMSFGPKGQSGALEPGEVFVSTLPSAPGGYAVAEFLGRVDAAFIRETHDLKDEGGLDSFIRLSMAEVLRAVRGYVTVLGGEGLVSLRFSLCSFTGSLPKNHAQCLLAVYGDIVRFCPVFAKQL